MAEVFEESFNTEQDTQKGKFLTFLLGKEVYAIEIKLVTEIICIQPITRLPELPDYMKGIVNLRGKIIPVMDVRLRFKMEPVEYNQGTCIIIIEENDISIGLIVDNVSEVLSIADENIVSPPNMNGSENGFIKAIGTVDNNVKLILDCGALFNGDDMETIDQAV